MSAHHLLLWIFLVAAALIAGIFFAVYRSSLRAAEDGPGLRNPKRIRFFVFSLLLALVLILLSATLPRSPYFLHANEVPAKVVYVQAMQYSFNLSLTDQPSYEDMVLPAGQLVEFRVRSRDVNHGFGVYNARYELVTQVQAMPGYVNRLRWVFNEPGTYHILCLEFCGMSHHRMSSSFTVQ